MKKSASAPAVNFLPGLLTGLLDPRKDRVYVCGPPGGGLTPAFAKAGFAFFGEQNQWAALSRQPILPGSLNPADCNTLAGVLLPGNDDNCGENTLRRYLDGPAQRLLLVVLPQLLYSNRLAPRNLRAELLRDDLVEAVLALPECTLPETGPLNSLLILNKKKPAALRGYTNFIEAGNLEVERLQELWKSGNFSALREMLRLALRDGSRDRAGVATETLLAGNASLAVRAWLPDPALRRISVPVHARTLPLGRIAGFVRPLLPRSEKAAEEPLTDTAYSLNIAQFSPMGYTLPEPCPEARVRVQVFTRDTDRLLRPGDILLGIRGSLGSVTMIDSEFDAREPWTATQSCLILRPTLPDSDPRLLFLFLRSDLGRAMVKQLNCGASIPMARINDLKQLPVVLPEPDEAALLLGNFAEEVRLTREIRRLEQQRRTLYYPGWQMPGPGNRGGE